MAETLWRDVASDYDRSFASLCAGSGPALLDRVPPRSGVVDVGSGSGHLTAALAAAGHRVIAVEPDPQMRALTGSRVGAPVLAGGLPDLPLAAGSVDVAVANFVLNHVDDPRAGARGLARVTAPGGRVLATIWGSTPPPQAVLWGGLLDRAGAERTPAPRLPADRDFDRSPRGLAGILTEAGLAVTHLGTEAWEWRVRAEDLWAGLTSVGNFGIAWRAQSVEVQQRVRAAYDTVGTELVFDVECVLVEARVPRA
jgi:SAM-dependent methyltransferase